MYLPQEPAQRSEIQKIFEKIVLEEGQTVLGWRDVPVNNSTLGETALACEPVMRHFFIGRNGDVKDDLGFERKLFVIRKRAEQTIRYSGKIEGGQMFYVCSLSYKTLVYKGMLTPAQVEEYFTDLSDPTMTTALSLVHSRFSTNTFPELGTRAPLPRASPQRRNQHAARQHQLDARPSGPVRQQVVR